METITTISGLVMGMTHLAKQSGVPSRALPIIALISGVGMAVLMGGLSAESATIGIQASLLASGLHSSVASMTKKKEVINTPEY